MATPNSQLAAELWPQILRRLERWQRNVGTGGGGGGTVTVEFTGTVTDAMAPQFLLRDGSRSLQGNLAVDSGVTIDGVDLDVHAGDAAAHHAPVTAGNGIALSGQQVAVNLATDPGLEFVGNLLRARITDGISRTAAGLGVSLATNPGLEFSSGALRAKIVTGDITRTSDGLGVNRAIAPTWTGVHTFNANPVIANNLSFTGARTINSNSTNALTLAPGGELVLDPGTTVTMAAGREFRSATFSDLVTGIAGFRAWDRGSNAYQLTIGGLKADELYARVFVADEVRIDRGEEFWSKSYGIVQSTFTLPALDTLFNVWFEDAPALASANLFSAGDWLMFRTVDWATGLVLSTVWCEVAYKNNFGTDRQQWALYRRSGGTTGQTIKAGSTALNMGQSGQGWVHLSALNSAGGPFVQVGTWAGANPYTPANVTNRVRMGHLSGVAGYSSGKYGFASGNNLGLTPATGFSGVTIEATDGARLYNTDIVMYEAGAEVASFRPGGIRIQYGSNSSGDGELARVIRWSNIATDTDYGRVFNSVFSNASTLYLRSFSDASTQNAVVSIVPRRGGISKSAEWTVRTGITGGAAGTSHSAVIGIAERFVMAGGLSVFGDIITSGLDSLSAKLAAFADSAGQVAFVARAAASPTAPAVEVQNSSGALSVGIWDDASIRVSSIMRLRAASGASIADNGTLDTGLGYGFVFVYSTTMGRGALFRIDIDGSVMISGSSSHYGTTVDTASRMNVYYNGSTVIVQNKQGSSINVRVWMMTA